MRETHKQGYRPGSYWVECPRCNWDYFQDELVEEKDSGKLVCPRCCDDSEETKSICAKW
jgi:hypothetical protein